MPTDLGWTKKDQQQEPEPSRDATGRRQEPMSTERDALERAHGAFWAHATHALPCPLAVDINAPDDTKCICGFDDAAGALMDDEEAHGMDFWKLARRHDRAPNLPRTARERDRVVDDAIRAVRAARSTQEPT